MNITDHPVYKFDRLLPLYNWLYPLGGQPSKRYQGALGAEVFASLAPSQGRALYFHVPFCETICSFCPFVRGKYRDPLEIESYVNALIKEIEIKSHFRPFLDAPVRAIYFGGGTPSLLDPSQIRRIGAAIRNHFDLSQLGEFSFEFEVKSVNSECIEALAEIGVTHARFGLQTFSAEYRRLFELTATIEQIEAATIALSFTFPHLSCDMLYGMNGQSDDDLITDIESVCNLGLQNIDFYPINNLMTQPKLHRRFRVEGKEPVSGLTKYYMNLLIRSAMESRGYLPHNGHGYVRVPASALSSPVAVTDWYSFIYHEHVYGYHFYDVLGFGTNAVSSFVGVSVHNTASRSQFVQALSEGWLPVCVKEHSRETDSCRPVCLRLPYHGVIEKRFVDWDVLPPSTIERLQALVAAGLIVDTGDSLELTREGWEWYSCIMYFLMPPSEKKVLDAIIYRGKADPARQIEATGFEDFALPVRRVASKGAAV